VALLTQPWLLAHVFQPSVRGKGVVAVKRYLTVKELAECLHICRASVYNYLKNIPNFPQPVKVGRLSRWDFEEIEFFMKSAPRGVYGEGHDRVSDE
jgi:predicted DNA-binding transcriptional regulator AlpA